jgi:hypothetical protein
MDLNKLDAMLDALENDLPGLILAYPDADGADFWMAFALRTSQIESTAGPANTPHARQRLDRMLDSRGLIPMSSRATAAG